MVYVKRIFQLEKFFHLMFSKVYDINHYEMKSISFKPDENKGPVIVLIGRRDTGKSYLVRDLLYHKQDIPVGTVISGTEGANSFYSSIMPSISVSYTHLTLPTKA